QGQYRFLQRRIRPSRELLYRGRGPGTQKEDQAAGAVPAEYHLLLPADLLEAIGGDLHELHAGVACVEEKRVLRGQRDTATTVAEELLELLERRVGPAHVLVVAHVTPG